MRRNEKIIAYAIIIVILLLLAAFFLVNAYNHYTILKTHRGYFNVSNPEVQSWMSFKLVESRFNITSEDILRTSGVNATRVNLHITLDIFCREYKLDCTELINRLNQAVRK